MTYKNCFDYSRVDDVEYLSILRMRLGKGSTWDFRPLREYFLEGAAKPISDETWGKLDLHVLTVRHEKTSLISELSVLEAAFKNGLVGKIPRFVRDQIPENVWLEAFKDYAGPAMINALPNDVLERRSDDFWYQLLDTALDKKFYPLIPEAFRRKIDRKMLAEKDITLWCEKFQKNPTEDWDQLFTAEEWYATMRDVAANGVNANYNPYFFRGFPLPSAVFVPQNIREAWPLEYWTETFESHDDKKPIRTTMLEHCYETGALAAVPDKIWKQLDQTFIDGLFEQFCADHSASIDPLELPKAMRCRIPISRWLEKLGGGLTFFYAGSYRNLVTVFAERASVQEMLSLKALLPQIWCQQPQMNLEGDAEFQSYFNAALQAVLKRDLITQKAGKSRRISPF